MVDGAERNSRDKTRKKNLQMTLLCLFHILRATHLNDNSIGGNDRERYCLSHESKSKMLTPIPSKLALWVFFSKRKLNSKYDVASFGI